MQNTRESFGEQLFLIRNKLGLSQDEVAEKAGITQNNLSRIERGLYSPGQDILLRIGDALGLQLKYD
ncbi:MAG TPA: helix-turn-helix transcriptional regulator [Paludibacter sp.]|nr:helix-turn-helix transcriptional regulator [Paludibacter sp.]